VTSRDMGVDVALSKILEVCRIEQFSKTDPKHRKDRIL
jgi:hypothetical protein